MEGSPKQPVSLIQSLVQLNEESGGSSKLFVFSLIKEEAMGSERRQIIKSGFSVAMDRDSAIRAYFEAHPQLKDFKIIDFNFADLGANPLPAMGAPQIPMTLVENPNPLNDPSMEKNVNNLFKLLIDEHSENDHEKEVLTIIQERIKSKQV